MTSSFIRTVGLPVLAVVVWTGLAFGQAQLTNLSSKPTFNCAKAKSSLPRLLCGDPAGAKADWDLVAASWARRFSLPRDERDAFEQAENNWLKSLPELCELNSGQQRFSSTQIRCVLTAYHGRAEQYRFVLKDDALIESRLAPEQRAELQQALAALGFLSDVPDGEFGSNTRVAIKQFQESNGLPASEFLSSAHKELLLKQARNSLATRQGGPEFVNGQIAKRLNQALGSILFGPGGNPIIVGAPPKIPSRRNDAQIASPGQSPSLPEPPNNSPFPRNPDESGGIVAPSVFPTAPTNRVDTPALRLPGAAQDGGTRTVEVTAIAETRDAAKKEATRLAIQQVAGVFVDNRRRVEIKMSDQKFSEIVEEKILSYTNAYVTKLEVLSTERQSEGYAIKARVTVEIAPLLKTLQASNVPMVAFDADSAVGTAESLGDEKRNALAIYSDLLARADGLVKIGLGKGQ